MKEIIEKMEDGKDKELMKILAEGGKPYVKKMDGYAVKCTEDKEITYKDYNEQELTLKVPAGSYVVTDGEGHYPKIVTAEDFEKKNKFVEGKKKDNPKKEEGPKIGLEGMEGY